LRFLSRFPSQEKADWLTPVRLENWLRAAGYSNPRNAPALHARLARAARGTIGSHAAGQAPPLVARLRPADRAAAVTVGSRSAASRWGTCHGSTEGESVTDQAVPDRERNRPTVRRTDGVSNRR
jgi:hypothetical protein